MAVTRFRFLFAPLAVASLVTLLTAAAVWVGSDYVEYDRTTTPRDNSSEIVGVSRGKLFDIRMHVTMPVSHSGHFHFHGDDGYHQTRPPHPVGLTVQSDPRYAGVDYVRNWHLAGGGYQEMNASDPMSVYVQSRHIRLIVVPLWWVVLSMAILPAFWVIDRLFRRRFPTGRCRRCGYDLQASPGRCPECGDADSVR